MSLLFDENLSPRLIRRLEAAYPQSEHVELVGLKGQSDLELWEYAARHGATLVSKDTVAEIPRPQARQTVNSGFEGTIVGMGAISGERPTLVAAVVQYKGALQRTGETQIIVTLQTE